MIHVTTRRGEQFVAFQGANGSCEEFLLEDAKQFYKELPDALRQAEEDRAVVENVKVVVSYLTEQLPSMLERAARERPDLFKKKSDSEQ